MLFFFGSKNDVKRVLKGERVTRICSSCRATCVFYEVEVTKQFNAYVVIPLWTNKKKMMQCGECLAVYEYVDVFPERAAADQQQTREEEEKAKEKEREKKKRAEQESAAQQAAAQQKAPSQEELIKKMRAEEERIKHESDQRQKDQTVSDELEELKRKMGKK